MQIQMIMRPLLTQTIWKDVRYAGFDQFFAYVERFDIVLQNGSIKDPNPLTGMYVLRCALRSDRLRQGHVVPIKYFCTTRRLIPRYGAKADTRYNKENLLEFAPEFWLNHYFNKELFYSLNT